MTASPGRAPTLFEPDRERFGEGAVLLRRWVDDDVQRELVARCLALADGPAGAYVPTVRGGGRMHVRMLCLGLHWNAQSYAYEATRSDFDGHPAPPLPPWMAAVAVRAAAAAGYDAFAPDVCIVNIYDANGRMGVHQDKDERPATLARGSPIVSVSLGDSARFVLGGLARRDPTQPIWLRSGDVFVLGGPSRLRYHGVTRVADQGESTLLGFSGRINLTFREY
ncbi:MAG: alpha-ketoglutarate-dependent dioxygenase AlkB [Vicinamibacterales bacterium]